MISTITLIITAVMRATQMAMRGAEKTSICLRKVFSNCFPTLFYWDPRLSGSSWRHSFHKPETERILVKMIRFARQAENETL